MRAVVQRVLRASVSVDGEVVGSVGRGLCVLVGLARDDTDADIDFMHVASPPRRARRRRRRVRKLLNVRLFRADDGERRWDRSVSDMGGEILCVSQFTLYCVLKGNKPDFHQAMGAADAPAFYAKFLDRLRLKYRPERVKDGRFGAMMKVDIENDGPVTITLDSRKPAAEAQA